MRDAIGGGPAIVRHGKVVAADDRGSSPPTSCSVATRGRRSGQRGDGRIVLVAVDGRQQTSAGITLTDLAEELVRLGVVTGMSFDSGGSTQIAFDGSVLNAPSDGESRAVSDALMILYYGAYAKKPENKVVSPNGDGVAEGQRLVYKIVRPSTVNARLLGPNGNAVWSYKGPRDPGEYPLEPDPKLLKQGSWRFVVSAVDSDGNDSKAAAHLHGQRGSRLPRALRPDDSRDEEAPRERSASRSRSADTSRVRVTVESSGSIVRTLYERRDQEPGHVSTSWNGRTSSNHIARAGRYVIRVRATNDIGPVELTDSVLLKRR